MKPLYWTRILANQVAPPCHGESDSVPLKPLWLEIEETKLDNIDEFTDLFSRQVVKAPVKKKVEVKTKIQPVKILDSKRSQNVGILAQSLHVEFSEIENAIYNFDTSVVSLEALQQIYELVSWHRIFHPNIIYAPANLFARALNTYGGVFSELFVVLWRDLSILDINGLITKT